MRLDRLRHESKYMAVRHFCETKGWSINWMCSQLGISRSAYYKWLHREIPVQERENIELAELIKEYDEKFGHILGYRRMTSWINHFNHTAYTVKRVNRIMKKLGIRAVIRKKKKKYQASSPETIAENILGRDFSKRQTMRTYANFKKYERMLLTVIAKTSRCYHRKEHSL